LIFRLLLLCNKSFLFPLALLVGQSFLLQPFLLSSLGLGCSQALLGGQSLPFLFLLSRK
jgi:hypothetical protein